ncbi:MAG: toprim domain-containing protein [Spirochaetales bacterium]|nr:toprim domain-containing protein [Spirochaetales bacterium]
MEKEFAKAKSVYLPILLKNRYGLKVKAQGRNFGVDYCPKCSKTEGNQNKVSLFVVAGVWRWKCFACDTPASSSIDWVCFAENKTAKQAVSIINEVVTDTIPIPSTAPVKREIQETCFPEVIKRLMQVGNNDAAKKYLQKRRIGSEVVDEAIQRGLVRSLPEDPYQAKKALEQVVGVDLMRKTGLLKEGKQWPAIAFRPVVFPQGFSGAEFRMMGVPENGEPKSIRYGRLVTPWWWAGQDHEKVLIVEGAIDGLSVVQMGWMGHVLALPGVSSWNPEWLGRLDTRYPGIEVYVGLDSDEAGMEKTEKIMAEAEAAKVKARRFMSWNFKDWNEALMAGATI